MFTLNNVVLKLVSKVSDSTGTNYMTWIISIAFPVIWC